MIKFENQNNIITKDMIANNNGSNEFQGICNNGEYEILYTNAFDGENSIQTIQGAEVKVDKVHLKSRINWIDDTKKEEGGIESISFVMNNDDAKLSSIFFTAPRGVIKKNRTGVGATTLEINSPRNSIIVVPTKALAKTKALLSKVENENRYKVL